MCGGSGAGMFIDIAYLLKMAYYQLSGGKGKPSVIGVELTPEAFTQIAIDPNVNSTGRIEGNGYAALAETYYFMNKEKFPPTQSAKDIISQDRRNKFMVNYGPIGKSNDASTYGTICEEPPFDQCYLLGTSNMDDIATYYAIASELIFTKIATQLRQAQNSMLDNASQILGQYNSDLEGKQLKCFSSAGFKSFYYPLDIIKDLYTYKLAMDLNYWLKQSVDKIHLDSMVQDFAENNPSVLDLTPEGLLALSKEIINRKDFWDNPRFHTVKVSKQKANEKDYEFIERKIREINADRIKKDDIRAQVRVKFEVAAGKAGESLRDKVIEIVNNPDLGAQVGIDFLIAFEKYLTRYPKDQMARKLIEIKGKLEKEKKEYIDESNKLMDKITGLSGLAIKFKAILGGELKEDVNSLLKEIKEFDDMEYEMFCLNCVEDFLKYLNIQAQNIRKKLEVFNYKLNQISKNGNLERAYEKRLSHTPRFKSS